MPENLDLVRLNLNDSSLWILNLCLAFIMFGVALSLRLSDFKQVVKRPKAAFTGIVSQFLLLPVVTILLIAIMSPRPSIALGMVLVAVCPGGNVSNFMTLLSKGNAALSVSLTAFSTLLAIVMTPIGFAFWGSLNGDTNTLLQTIQIDAVDILKTVALLLGIPLILGISFARFYPRIAERINRPIRTMSIIIFLGFVVIAFAANFEYFLRYIHIIVILVLLHNAAALLTGYWVARGVRLSKYDARSISIETGIQNSGLGLILIFNFFGGLGGMAIVAGWWGIWHILSGLSLAYYWSKKY